jgi:hypothetical protein
VPATRGRPPLEIDDGVVRRDEQPTQEAAPAGVVGVRLLEILQDGIMHGRFDHIRIDARKRPREPPPEVRHHLTTERVARGGVSAEDCAVPRVEVVDDWQDRQLPLHCVTGASGGR